MMNLLPEYNPETYALIAIVVGILFTTFWYFDHKVHLRIWRQDITDGELKTHRMILYASYGLLGSLAIMAIQPVLAVPLFAASWLTRFVHEAIDEFHWHLPRCTEAETLIHLAMWVLIHTGTFLCLIWGLVYKYEGLFALPPVYLVSIGLVVTAMLWIGHHEIFDYKTPRDLPPEAKHPPKTPREDGTPHHRLEPKPTS